VRGGKKFGGGAAVRKIKSYNAETAAFFVVSAFYMLELP
jgi:hypothetical protein